MNPIKRALTTNYCTLTEEQAERVSYPSYSGTPVRILPPSTGSVPATIGHALRNVRELKSDWLKLRNKSPVIAFEIRRVSPETLTLQYALPTNRLERKLRSQLHVTMSGIDFADGDSGLPVNEGETVGGSLLTTGHDDWYPLRTEFQYPPTNALIAALHRHAMQDTKFVIQILLKPLARERLQKKWYGYRARQQQDYLRKEKEKLWGSRKPTKRERQQADAMESKTSRPQWSVSIRVIAIGAGDYTGSRVHETTAGFNAYEHPESGQYLTTVPVTAIREKTIYRFTKAVADRVYRQWSRKFKATDEEVGTLCAIPNRVQDNLQQAGPR
jgi:hypothetical protein